MFLLLDRLLLIGSGINCIYDEYGPENKLSLPFSVTCISSIKKIFDILKINPEIVKNLLYHPRFGMTHYADDDALYQAWMYLRITNWIKNNIKVN